ncbi:hypothetical protein BGX38DRAFT_631468 [Terfezia claveryi]|nr:hypothetical protein BGX38DRAFT_631468 [Terfezia claveryi]
MPSNLSNLLLSPFHLLTWSIRHLTSSLLFLFSPFFIVLYYASYVFAPVYTPFQFLSRFEPIYIFCGTAAVIGISVGCLLCLTNSMLFSFLNLTNPSSTYTSTSSIISPDNSTPQGIKRFRDERRRRRSEVDHRGRLPKRQQKAETPRTPPQRKPKSIPNTILEEEDEEEYYGTTTPAESLGGRETIGLTRLKRKEGHYDTDGESGS